MKIFKKEIIPTIYKIVLNKILLKTRPNKAYYNYMLGSCFEYLDCFEKAISYFTQALNLGF